MTAAPTKVHARAPAPDVLCAECGGLAPDPDFEAPCGACGGSGVAPVCFALGPTHSYAVRVAAYAPRCRRGNVGLLVLGTAAKWAHKRVEDGYAVAEFGCDFAGRAFALAKLGGGAADRHQLFLGDDGSATCTCEGDTYESSARADRRARESGGETFAASCKHLDALRALCASGWFDLN